MASSSSLRSSESASDGFADSTRTKAPISVTSAARRFKVLALAASIAAAAAALAAACEVAIWITNKHAASAVTNVITAAVIAIRNVSLMFRQPIGGPYQIGSDRGERVR